ncbi:MAG: glycosyltransferase family A protein [bacterium]
MPACDVTVILPVYNRRDLLREALASVYGQSLPPREVVVVDDGSEDGSCEGLPPFAEGELRVLRQDRRGPAAARNRGLAEARGKYIAFLDSDDRWLPKKLEVQVSFLEANPEYRLCQTEEIWIRQGVRVNPMKKHAKPSGWIFADCLRLCLISPSAVMLDRQWLLELGGFDASFEVCEDYELWLRASLRSPIRTLPQALTIKRGGHPDQLSRAHWGMDRYRVRAIEKTLAQERLTPEQARLAKAELAKKLAILSKGFAKRHPHGPDPYQEKLSCLAAGLPILS